MDRIRKYTKIELILNSNDVNSPQPLITYNNCEMFITGNFMIINENREHRVYNLEKIKQYRTNK